MQEILGYGLNEGLPVRCLTMDRHITITSKMKSVYPEIVHQYDVWHVSKSVVKKLTKKAKMKSNEELTPWIKSVSNHLWWSVATCNGDRDLLKEKWLSVLHHTANKHNRWPGFKKFKKCEHHKLSRKEQKAIQWLKPGSSAHAALDEVVSNQRLLKDLEKLTEFHHTGDLEVYHSSMLKYLPKREHFSYRGMLARLQLAALSHNHNCDRKQAAVGSGENKGMARYKVECPKRTNEWVAKPIKEKKTNGHLKVMMKKVLEAKEADITDSVDIPVLPRNIAKKARPEKDTVVNRHISRMNKSHSK